LVHLLDCEKGFVLSYTTILFLELESGNFCLLCTKVSLLS
jgi:hypothetical protein